MTSSFIIFSRRSVELSRQRFLAVCHPISFHATAPINCPECAEPKMARWDPPGVYTSSVRFAGKPATAVRHWCMNCGSVNLRI